MTNDVVVELSPCPSGHVGTTRNNNNIYGAWWVQCAECSWRTGADTEAEAIAAWNTRHRIEALAAREGEEPSLPRVDVLPDPSHMPWQDLLDALHDRFGDDDYEDDELCLSRAEACAALSWARHFERQAEPRREEEEKTFALIKSASELMQSGSALAAFEQEQTGFVWPMMALRPAIPADEALREAVRDLLAHRVGDLPSRGWLRDNDESRASLARLVAALGPSA